MSIDITKDYFNKTVNFALTLDTKAKGEKIFENCPDFASIFDECVKKQLSQENIGKFKNDDDNNLKPSSGNLFNLSDPKKTIERIYKTDYSATQDTTKKDARVISAISIYAITILLGGIVITAKAHLALLPAAFLIAVVIDRFAIAPYFKKVATEQQEKQKELKAKAIKEMKTAAEPIVERVAYVIARGCNSLLKEDLLKDVEKEGYDQKVDSDLEKQSATLADRINTSYSSQIDS